MSISASCYIKNIKHNYVIELSSLGTDDHECRYIIFVWVKHFKIVTKIMKKLVQNDYKYSFFFLPIYGK